MDPAPPRTPDPDRGPDIVLRCWGTRGSIPSPGPDTAFYGGNTTCLEVRIDGRRLIFDAGSGMRPLGQELVQKGVVLDTPIFLTHFHWDHIQGFPFFVPLYTPGAELTIMGPKQKSIDVRSLFAGQMGPIYFPVPFGAVAANLSFGHINEETWEGHGITLTTLKVKHPSYVVGYRIQIGEKAVCFIPDDELEGESYDVRPGWRDRLLEFTRDADLLIHDSMYTEEEYPSRLGWGHSTFQQSLRLAEEAGARRLLFFHHDPDRSDAALSDIVDRIRDEALARGCPVEMSAAREGIEFTLDGELT